MAIHGQLPVSALCCCCGPRGLGRRSFLLESAAAAFACRAVAAADIRTPLEEVAQFPLIDNQSHLLPKRMRDDLGTTPEDLIAAMDQAGIHRMVVAGFGPEVADLPRRFPGRFVAAYILYNFRWRQDPRVSAMLPERYRIGDGTKPAEVDAIGGEFEEALASGRYNALAEITTIALPIRAAALGAPGAATPGSNVPPDSPLVMRLIELAGRHDVPINIHCEDSAAAAMVRAVRSHPRTRVIWAHTGSYMSPGKIQVLLADHRNLDFDLSSKNVLYGQRAGSLLGGGRLDKDWAQLFERFADRFHFGVDFLTSHHLRAAAHIGAYARAVLSQLTPATARKIAYQNAARSYRL
ncbi:MAG: amidohydrolase family protein [Rhodospirillales bacterium]